MSRHWPREPTTPTCDGPLKTCTLARYVIEMGDAVGSWTTSWGLWSDTGATSNTTLRIRSKGSYSGCSRRLGERGNRKRTVFDFDETRPYDLRIGNPIEVIFKTYLMHELRSVCGGKIPALRKVQRPGTVSIGYGDNHASPDEIPGREETDDREMIADITDLLRRRSTPDLNLVDLFKSILHGEGTRIQRQTFGYDRADAGRKAIVQTIQRYAHDTQNWHLLRLLDRFSGFSANRPDPGRKKVEKKPIPPKSPRSTLPPDEADYRSIVQVLEKHDRSVSMMVLGKVRVGGWNGRPAIRRHRPRIACWTC